LIVGGEKMVKKYLLFLVLVLALGVSSCGQAATAGAVEPEIVAATEVMSIATASPTIDPCVEPYLQVLVKNVNDHMREFDDASTLAASLTNDKLPPAISELQRIRRAAQDERVPSCLGQLKDLQVGHMNTVINTLLGLLNGAKPEDLQKGIDAARKLHDEYTLQLATLLGLTVVEQPTNIPAATGTVTP
jgi:hypothetical protein